MHVRSVLLALLVGPGIAGACTYCDPSNLKLQSFRQEARSAKFVVVGTLANPRLVGEQGYTDLVVETVVKDDPALGKRKTLTLPRWQPVDPKKPTRMVVFFDVYDGKLDPFRGAPLKGTAVADYLRGTLEIDDRERVKSLLYCFRHLDSPDPDVAADAYLEFAKASDQEIGTVGPKLDPVKLRKFLADPKTPADRLGLFAFLLGACGTKADGDALAALLAKADERTGTGLSGILGGLIELRPSEGWAIAVKLIEDPKRPYNDKLAVLATYRFFHAYKPAESRKAVLAGMAAVVARGDMADMAIEDLRRWKWWDLTADVLAQYGKPTHTSPIVRNAIVRYALCSPDSAAVAFVKTLRVNAPVLVKDIEDSIEFERTAPLTKPKP